LTETLTEGDIMQTPLQITFRNMKSSEIIEADIRKYVDKLTSHHRDIISCHVIVEAPAPHHHKGGLFKTRIDVTCPEGKFVINREPPAQHKESKDVHVSLRDAFNAVERQLDEYVDKRKGEVKMHVETPRGRIKELFPMEDYGTIITTDDREIYFHRNSVLNKNFDDLTVGAQVRFHEETGNNGPQASSVKVED
jgi:cold shock CspA family protein/ribosome-associated translation inhibitor RaiA